MQGKGRQRDPAPAPVSDDDQVVGQKPGAGKVGDGQPVPAAEVEDQVAIDHRGHPQDLRHAARRAAPQRIVHPDRVQIVLEIQDHVGTMVEEESVGPGPAAQQVCTRAARQDVVAGPSEQVVGALLSRQPVGTVAAPQRVRAAAAAMPPQAEVIARFCAAPEAA